MRPLLNTLFSALLFASIAWAQEGDVPADADKDRLDYMTARLNALSITETAGTRQSAQLREAPLMTWQNPISGANGGVFVWLIRERPVALSKVHVNDRKRHYVEASVTLRDGLEWREASARIWTPEACTAVVCPTADLAAPRETPAGRLQQMRSLAERFEIEDQWGEGQPETYHLRLLARPLYRYSAPEECVLDGAIFGYSQGTNPEAVVVIEAVTSDSGTGWECRISRLTGYALTARRDGEVVMEAPRIIRTTRTANFRKVYERPSPYPFSVPD